MKKYKASSLVIDFDIYPRGHIDSQHVAYMVAAKDSGATFPPIIIDKKSKRIVDGVHRFRMEVRINGDDALIECVEKTYKSDADLLLDSIRLNAAHGQSLTRYDRARCALLAEQFKIEPAELASAMNMTIQAVGELVADRTATDKATQLHVPLKRTIRHKAGMELNTRQLEANGRLSGMNQQFYVNQLIELIEAKLLDTADEKLMSRLLQLYSLLGPIVGGNAVDAA